MRGEDVDGVAYQTAKACIFGLVDICSTATHEAPTSSVIRGICAAVFQNVLIFFTSSLEGKEIYGIKNKEILMLQDPIENFCALKQEKEDDSDSSLNKLFKYGALCLLRIFFSFPKNLLAACFELITASGADTDNKHGQYFLDQVTRPLKADGLSHPPNKNDGVPLSTVLAPISADCEILNEEKCVSGDIVAESTTCSSNCFMGMVVNREPSLKDWILARYKKLAESPGTHDALGISSYLEKVLGPVQELIKESVYVQSDEENFDSTTHALRHAVYRKVIHDDNLGDLSGKDHASEQESSFSKTACVESITPRRTTHNLQSHKSVHLSDVDINISNRSFVCEGEIFGSISKLETGTFGGSNLDKSSRPNGSTSQQFVSAISRSLPGSSLLDFRNDATAVKVDNIHDSNASVVAQSIPSPKHNLSLLHHTSDHLVWYTDGDHTSMNVFSASKLLWLGSLGCHASEASVRQRLENFGHIEQFLFLPVKNFALVEYRNLMDAVKAREYMQGSSQWGGFLKVKFIDIGLGCRGVVNGTAVGDSCHVYVGKAPNQWSKDDVLHGLMRKGVRKPLVVTDLTSESALLLEFGSSEDATAAMTHIRHLRKDSNCQLPSNSSFVYPEDRSRDMGIPSYHEECQTNQGSSTSTGYFPIHVDPRAPSRETIAQAPYSSYLTAKSENFIHELASPRVKMEKSGTTVSKGHDIQSNWSVKGITELVNVGSRELESNISMELPISETPTSLHNAEPVWRFGKPEIGAQLFVHGTMPYTHGSSVIPPPIHSTSSIRPFYSTNNSWDNPPLNPSFIMPPHDRRHLSSYTPLPFIPSSITPLSQIPTGSIQIYDGTVNVSNMSALIPPPPLLSSPPPLPPSQPPPIPPPPTSPPPIAQPTHEITKLRSGKLHQQHQWQGTLSKSGVHYCTLYATREGTLTCKYINAGPEPAEWPAKLDVTKRTDFRHVRTTFGNIPPHRREVCRLLPSTTSDNKGFNDFISYLRQRECAGVIKIPAVRSMWARLLFILPHSLELCTMLGISPQPTESLIAVVLPKETGLDLL